MSQVIAKIAVVALAVVGLFTAGLVSTLGFRGKLNRESLAEMVGAEAAPGVSDASPGVDVLHAQLAGGGAAKRETAAASLAGTLLPRLTLPSPFSTDESARLFAELESTRTELKGRIAAVAQQERDLELIRADLNRRWDELDEREQQLEEQSKSLAAEREEIAGRTVLVEEAELENLSNFARKIEKMKSQAAAELLQQRDPAEAAKILSFVRDREAGKIMENLPPEFLAKVAERAIGILRPDMKASGAGAPGETKDSGDK